MTITKQYKDVKEEPEVITTAKAIEYLEGSGCYRPGTVAAIIEKGSKHNLQTNFAFYEFR